MNLIFIHTLIMLNQLTSDHRWYNTNEILILILGTGNKILVGEINVLEHIRVGG